MGHAEALQAAKGLFNSRIAAEKRTPEYQVHRMQLRNEGVPPHQAWLKAALCYPPLDGSDHELIHFAYLLDEAPPPPAEVAPAEKKDDRPSHPTQNDGPEFSKNGSEQSVEDEELDAFLDGDEFDEEDDEEDGDDGNVEDDPAEVLEPQVAPEKPAAAAKPKRASPRKRPRYAKSYEDLKPLVDPTKRCDFAPTVEWVFHHYMVDWHDIDPERVPSIAALDMLNKAKTNEQWYNNVFFEKLYLKTFTKKDNSDTKQFNDDGRLLALMTSFERSFYEAAERSDDDDDYYDE